ncbi:MAG: hypothetical protein ABIJ72_03420 [bacterium]
MANPFNIQDITRGLDINSNITTDPSPGGSQIGYGIFANAQTNPQFFIYNAIVVFLALVSIGTVVVLILAGVKYITAAGDAEKAESAKKTIFGAVIGMLIILASFVAFNFAVSVLNSPPLDEAQIKQKMEQTYPTIP